jgi:selenium-binding protein 1
VIKSILKPPVVTDWCVQGTALGSSLVHIFKKDGEWTHDVAIKQEATGVEGWALPQMPPLITDVVIDLNDRFVYFSNWLRGMTR